MSPNYPGRRFILGIQGQRPWSPEEVTEGGAPGWRVSLWTPRINSGHMGKADKHKMETPGSAALTQFMTKPDPAGSCQESALKTHLSASTSRGGVPWSQLFTIHAVSKAARKPRAQPVPMGQNGYKRTHAKFWLITDASQCITAPFCPALSDRSPEQCTRGTGRWQGMSPAVCEAHCRHRQLWHRVRC